MTTPAPAGAIEIAFGAGLSAGAGQAGIAIGHPGKPLRLNDAGIPMPIRGSIAAKGSIVDVLLAALKRLCDPWDQAAHRLLDRYFAFLTQTIVRERDAVEARLAPFDGLYAAQDFLFSAPAPLPSARIANAGGEDLSDLQIPFVFWLGDGITALLEHPPRLTPLRARERAARLERAGVRVRSYRAHSPGDGDEAYFGDILGPRMTRFFETEPVPCAPASAAPAIQ